MQAVDFVAGRKLQALFGLIGTFGIILASQACLAGPPFLTDDPQPLDPGHWKINNYAAATLARGASTAAAPGIDANYGAGENVQLHMLGQAAFAQWSGVTPQFGAGDTELGVKYRFLSARENDWWPQIAIYPTVAFPIGNANRGLGSGATHAFLPVWVQKDFGKWTTYGGGGYWINPGAGNQNYWFAGWVVQYQLTETLALGGEIFHMARSSTGGPGSPLYPLGTKPSTGFNFGGTYDLSDTYHLLFSLGRGFENASATNRPTSSHITLRYG